MLLGKITLCVCNKEKNNNHTNNEMLCSLPGPLACVQLLACIKTTLPVPPSLYYDNKGGKQCFLQSASETRLYFQLDAQNKGHK